MKFKIIYQMSLILAVCAALGRTAAADPSDGPFADLASLVAFWQADTGTVAAHIFLNGHQVFNRTGFGPAFFKQYFICHNDIRPVCPGIADPSSTTAHLISLLSSPRYVFLDGTQIQSGAPGSTLRVLDLITCPGDLGTHYFVATFASDGFSPVILNGGACRP